jgi:putative ABC transport system substrate-binding protein
VREFHQGLRQAGFIEGRNVLIEYRWAEDRTDRLPAMAIDLFRRQVAVIFANGPAALPAKAAAVTIPIVFVTAVDPVEEGLIRSLSQPSGNVPGVTTLNVEVGAKQLQLLHEVVPSATTIAVLVNQTVLVPRFKRGACQKWQAHSGCSSTFCMRAPKAIWKSPSQSCFSYEPAHSSPKMRFSVAKPHSSRHSRFAT